MKILIAEDDPVSSRMIERFLEKWGYEILTTSNGMECYETLCKSDVQLLILDWIMPQMSGLELTKKIRSERTDKYFFIIILTAKSDLADIVKGFEAGADDYLTKPFYPQELKVRIKVGERFISMQNELRDNISNLEDSLKRIKSLEDMLPICMYCKKIRDDKNYWHKVEKYISERVGTRFSHGICPECYKKMANNLKGKGD